MIIRKRFGQEDHFYFISQFKDYVTVSNWMDANGVEYMYLVGGQSGWAFKVVSNEDWFILRWGNEIT